MANVEAGNKLSDLEKSVAAAVISIGASSEFHALRAEILASNGDDYIEGIRKAKWLVLR